VLVEGPDHHLNDTDDQENEGAGVTTLNAEEDPAKEFPPIVGTADPLEAPSLGDTASVRTGLAQVPQCDVAHEVEVLEKYKERCEGQHETLIAGPLGRAVLGVQEKVHVEEAKKYPVVETVLQQIENGHRII
jgi:hypothetical protein